MVPGPRRHRSIKLTCAGYLPPPDVEAAVAELGLAAEWHGKFNRESQTLPVLDLRESAMRLGLLRKYKGTLLATSHGRKLRGDPVARHKLTDPRAANP